MLIKEASTATIPEAVELQKRYQVFPLQLLQTSEQSESIQCCLWPLKKMQLCFVCAAKLTPILPKAGKGVHRRGLVREGLYLT